MGGLFYILFFCVFVCSEVTSKKHGHVKSGGKIVGGSNTTINQYPYQAYLLLQQGNDYYQCGGSIISTRAIMTAAHCVQGISQAYIRIGSTSSDSGGSEYQSSMLVPHPLYNTRPNDYDVAIIKLGQSMKLNGVTARAVQLPSRGASVPSGTNLTVTGWGATSEGGSTSSTLMSVTVPAMSNEECSTKLSGITSRMLCAGVPEGGRDSCQGDSGGPAVQEDGVQVGVVSFGVGCARPDLPGVYARVASVRTWIKIMTGV